MVMVWKHENREEEMNKKPVRRVSLIMDRSGVGQQRNIEAATSSTDNQFGFSSASEEFSVDYEHMLVEVENETK